MFIGEYRHTVDEKGRLAIPTKFRKELKAGAVVTRGLDGCLFVYSLAEWKKLADKIAALPVTNIDSRAFSRLMLAGAMDVALDGQGRVVVPEYLRQFAGLGREVVVTGLYNRLEVWAAEAWETYKTDTERQTGDIAAKMAGLGV